MRESEDSAAITRVDGGTFERAFNEVLWQGAMSFLVDLF